MQMKLKEGQSLGTNSVRIHGSVKSFFRDPVDVSGEVIAIVDQTSGHKLGVSFTREQIASFKRQFGSNAYSSDTGPVRPLKARYDSSINAVVIPTGTDKPADILLRVGSPIDVEAAFSSIDSMNGIVVFAAQ